MTHALPVAARFLLAGAIALTVVTYFLGANGHVNDFATYSGALAFLAAIFTGRDTKVLLRSPSAMLSFILLTYLALSAAWSNDGGILPVLHHAGFAMLMFAFVYGIPLVHRDLSWFADGLVTLLVLAGIVSCGWSIYLYYALPDYHPLVEDRLYALGRLHNPAIGAMAYGLVIACLLHRLTFARPWQTQGLYTLALGLLLFAIFLTGTRGVWAGLFAALITSLLLHPDLVRRRKRLGLLISLAIPPVLAGAIWASGYDDELWRRSLSYRPFIWSTFLHKIIAGHPVIGAGANAASRIHGSRYAFDHAHSIYLSTLYYGGMVGLTLFLTLLATTVKEMLKPPSGPLKHLVITVLAYSLVTLFFDGDRLLVKVDHTWMMIWLPIALAIGVEIKARAEPPEPVVTTES